MLCVSIHAPTTTHFTQLRVGPVKCHLISLYTPRQLFSVSVWLNLQRVKLYLCSRSGSTDGDSGM